MIVEKQQKKLFKPGCRNPLRIVFYEFPKWIRYYFKAYFYYLYICVSFRRGGNCNQCGRCCRHVYLRDRGNIAKSFGDCLALIKADKRLGRFSARGRNSSGEIYFACDFIGRDNKCSDYKKRPQLCRTYPSVKMMQYGGIPKGDCGFYFYNRFTGKRVTD